MANEATRIREREDEPSSEATCTDVTQFALNAEHANRYRARFAACNELRNSSEPQEAGFVIVRNNGRAMTDFFGKPAVFRLRTEAQRWVMPDEHVERRGGQ